MTKNSDTKKKIIVAVIAGIGATVGALLRKR